MSYISGPVDEELNRSVTFLENSMERPFGLGLLRDPDDEDEDDDELFLERLCHFFLPLDSLERFERPLRGLSTDEDDDEEDFSR